MTSVGGSALKSASLSVKPGSHNYNILMPQEIGDVLADGQTFNVTTIAGTGDLITGIVKNYQI